ncbi:hypothetical protein [Burkholderia sp. LMG 21824]|uniref:hypothetical protein n=1 Tax=Burkholderia sp. LMG 21824 TaxID=3158172 RepID=UPI003C30A084
MSRAIPRGAEVWIVTLSDADPVCEPILIRDDDRARYGKIRLSRRRRLFAFRRHVREYVLRQYAPHHSIRMEGASGRPYLLSRRGRQPLYFSYAASGGICAVGISRCPLGLDVEAVDRPIDMVALCTRFFPGFPTWDGYSGHEEWLRKQAFGSWCRTEAYGKLSGIPLHALLVDRDRQMTRFVASRAGNDAVIYGQEFVCAISQRNRVRVDSVIQVPFSTILHETSNAENY